MTEGTKEKLQAIADRHPFAMGVLMISIIFLHIAIILFILDMITKG